MIAAAEIGLRLSRAQALQSMGASPQATLEAFGAVLDIAPGEAAAWVGMGEVLARAGQPIAALNAFDRAIAADPVSIPALAGRGFAFLAIEEAAAALESFEAALKQAPAEVNLQFGRAVSLHKLLALEAAEAAYRQVLNRQPDHFEAWNNLIALRQGAGRIEDALALGEAALAHWPGHPTFLTNIGLQHQILGQLPAARAAYNAALASDPSHALSNFHLSLLDLLQGDFEAGLRGMEWRKQRLDRIGYRAYPQPEWRGDTPVAGKRLLIHAEQGFGDSIQFCRYLPLLADQGARVMFACQDELVPLMRSLDARVEVVDLNAKVEFDLHSPLMSLPFAFGTRAATIPAQLPYLSAEADRVAAWRRRLGDQGFKVGVAWRGSRSGVERGTALDIAAFAPLAELPGVRLISLQKGEGEEALATAGFPVESLGPGFDAGPAAFLDSAAVMASLDLVITLDSALAHLAGALGRPVWTMLPQVPDWRWMLERQDSPWYPGMALLRQSRRGDWSGPAAEAKARLATLLESRNQA